jgi:hypothetical protein
LPNGTGFRRPGTHIDIIQGRSGLQFDPDHVLHGEHEAETEGVT